MLAEFRQQSSWRDHWFHRQSNDTLHTSVFHNRHTVNDGTRLGVHVKKIQRLIVLAQVFEDADVVQEHFRVLYVVVWDVLVMRVVRP